jgi:hypothetical protein
VSVALSVVLKSERGGSPGSVNRGPDPRLRAVGRLRGAVHRAGALGLPAKRPPRGDQAANQRTARVRDHRREVISPNRLRRAPVVTHGHSARSATERGGAGRRARGKGRVERRRLRNVTQPNKGLPMGNDAGVVKLGQECGALASVPQEHITSKDTPTRWLRAGKMMMADAVRTAFCDAVALGSPVRNPRGECAPPAIPCRMPARSHRCQSRSCAPSRNPWHVWHVWHVWHLCSVDRLSGRLLSSPD